MVSASGVANQINANLDDVTFNSVDDRTASFPSQNDEGGIPNSAVPKKVVKKVSGNIELAVN